MLTGDVVLLITPSIDGERLLPFEHALAALVSLEHVIGRTEMEAVVVLRCHVDVAREKI